MHTGFVSLSGRAGPLPLPIVSRSSNTRYQSTVDDSLNLSKVSLSRLNRTQLTIQEIVPFYFKENKFLITHSLSLKHLRFSPWLNVVSLPLILLAKKTTEVNNKTLLKVVKQNKHHQYLYNCWKKIQKKFERFYFNCHQDQGTKRK